ncbi:uroporphyrinogen-III synthase-like isoform X1 [Montipora capricornis]|uniref:uroporphyrinogen-III synthase-like isoform X1 n=2 Tax=Montipora capricornis TaxID=246305 RepID=UPI0035F15423
MRIRDILARDNCLKMTLVVLFRSPSPIPQEDDYHKVLLGNGMKPISIPVLSFKFNNLHELAQKLQEPCKYGGMVLTSQRAVEAIECSVNEFISKEVWKNSIANVWQQRAIFVVGKASAKAATEKLGLQSTGQEAGSAEALVPIIWQSVKPAGNPLLFPCGNMRRETIPTEMEKAGIPLDSVQVYSTCADLNIKQSLEDLIKVQGTPSYAVFFSPSGVNFTADILSSITEWWNRVKLVAIGKTTAEAMKKKEWTVRAVADQPNPQALAQCIALSMQE